MKLEKVKYTCPQCGKQWTALEDPDDDWFRLGTNQTLCGKCGKEVIKKLVEEWHNEDIPSWPRSHG